MFKTNPEDLIDLLKKADNGSLQLPQFQRSFVWDDENVQNLIASVLRGYPIGAFLSLETGGEINFKPRLLERAKKESSGVSPDVLLLDGQQRLTSLYQAIYSKDPVRTINSRGREVKRFYYLDIPKTLLTGADIRDAFISVPADRILRSDFGRAIEKDLSTRDQEFENHAFPLNRLFDYAHNWLYGWRDHWREREEGIFDLERHFYDSILRPILNYKIPVIELDKSNGREAICLIFEKVNTGGKPLDTFELLTAIYAAEEFDLRLDWYGPTDKSEPGRSSRIMELPTRLDVLSGVTSTDFLQACALLHTREERLAKEREGYEGRNLPQVSCTREALLSLPLGSYRKYADIVESGFKQAASFLNEQKVISQRDAPYAPLIVGLAATFAILRRENGTVSAVEKGMIGRWFWSMTFGEVYGSRTESLLARDVPELVKWLTNAGPQPRTLDDASFQQNRLLSMTTRNSAAYKGVHALLMGFNHGCRDFVNRKPADLMTYFTDRIDIHHVFPQAWCRKNGIPDNLSNSIINKTPLSAESNRFIGGGAPSQYLRRIQQRYGISANDLDEILKTHLLEPEHLRNDDFDSFFKARSNALASAISDAMGKPFVTEQGADEEELDVDEPEEDNGNRAGLDLADLIAAGESDDVEFKSTLRVNLHTRQPDKRMEHAALKSLAGFLNTKGGTLIIGVSDDGSPVGIEADKFPSEDRMNLHLVNIVNARLGPTAMTSIQTSFVDWEGERVLTAACRRSPAPVYLKDGDAQRFYVRTGPATTELTASQMVRYISDNFKG